MPPWIRIGILTLMVTGCSTGTQVPAPDVKSMLDFAAYPGATLQRESTYGSAPIPWPGAGSSSTRQYQTADAPAQVRAYYETLAKTHGWTFDGPSPAPAGVNNQQEFLMLRRQRFAIAIDARPAEVGASSAPALTEVNVTASNNNQ